MAEWATISADVCTEEQKLDNKKLYFEIKENVLQKADHTRELSNQELKDCIEGNCRKEIKKVCFLLKNADSMQNAYLPHFGNSAFYRN